MKSLVLVLALTTATAGQSGGGAVAGAWTAEFAGRTFVRLVLTDKGGTVTGAMSLGASIEVDKQGAVSRAEAAPAELTPIFDVMRRGAMLTFSRKDDTEVDRFEVRFLDTGRAELQFVISAADRKELAAAGVPAPKPIGLTRK